MDVDRASPDLFKLEQATGKETHEPRVKEVILDIVASFPGSLRQYRIYVTIHSPFAVSCSSSNNLPSSAAVLGEKQRYNRYDPLVLPMSFETCGRLGKKSLESLKYLRQKSLFFGLDSSASDFADWQWHLETTCSPVDAWSSAQC